MKKMIFSIMICIMAVSVSNSAEMNDKADITTFPAKGITSVYIRTDSGLIDVKASQIADIRVEQLPDNAEVCDVTMRIEGKKLILKALVKEGDYRNIKTGFRIKLPYDIKIIARNTSGEINIRAIKEDVNAEATSGDIEIHNITGFVKVKTSSGDIEIKNITGSFEGRATSGDIEFDNVFGSLKVKTTSGKIEGIFKSVKVSKKINLKTTSGDVSVGFPKNAIIAVDVRTNAGKIHNDFSGETGLPVIIRTNSGDISVVKN